MDDQRYHGEEPAGEGHEPKAPEDWNWIVPGSTPSPRRGRAPKAEDASRWDVLPESPGRTSQWPAHTDTGTTGTSGREWWAEVDPEPFAIQSARRLSPRSMVVGPINQLRGLLLPIVVGLFIGGFNPWLLAATAAAIISLLIGGFVTWQTLRYEITEDRIEIRRGLVRRERRTIPLERIRGVDVTSTLLHRLLGVAVVRIEAAAGSGATEDGKLDAVDVTEADRLRHELLRRKAELTGQEDGATRDVEEGEKESVEDGTAQDAQEAAHFTMPRSWYLYGALSLAYLVTPFAVLATLIGLVQQSAGELVTDTAVDWLVDVESGLLITFAIGAAVVLVLLMPVFAVVSYTLTHWGFTLKGRSGSLVAERGLFTRRSVALEKRRIRGYELLDSPLERTRHAVRLRAVVTGLGDTATRAMLLPTGPRSVVSEVVDRTLTGYRGKLRRHPRAALGRRLVRSVLPFLVVAVVAAVLGWTWTTLSAGLLALLGVPLGVDRYRSLGHGDDGERVSVRSGSLQRKQVVVERSAVIGWTWTQTLFQRRSGLADLQVTVGAGAGGYTAQDAALSESVAFAAGVTPRMVLPFLLAPEAEGDAPGTR